uniref:HEPN domain-containing protein n=1 Tax=Mesocestoides corti TaxID=53468 RepID=A0A5K3FST5_MESCO
MLDRFQSIRNQFNARLLATSNGEDADAIRAALQACKDADNALRFASCQLKESHSNHDTLFYLANLVYRQPREGRS